MPERLLKYYRPYRKTLFFALLGSVITSALDLCFPLFMRYILGDVLPEGNLFLLGQATIILLFLYLLNFYNQLSSLKTRPPNGCKNRTGYAQ